MKIIKFANNQSLTNLAELPRHAEYAKVSKGKWYHCQRVYVIQSKDGQGFGLVSLNFFERLARNIFKVDFFKKEFEGRKVTLLSSKNLPQAAQTANAVSQPIQNNSNWVLGKEEEILLKAMFCFPCYRAGAEIPEEFSRAFTCMKEKSPENFKPLGHYGQGTHMQSHHNAVDFLKDCVSEKSVFRQIIDAYKEKQAKNESPNLTSPSLRDNPFTPITYGELAQRLEILLDRVKSQLEV